MVKSNTERKANIFEKAAGSVGNFFSNFKIRRIDHSAENDNLPNRSPYSQNDVTWVGRDGNEYVTMPNNKYVIQPLVKAKDIAPASDYMGKAVREAYVAAAVIDSNPEYQGMDKEEVRQQQKAARSIRSREGQHIICGGGLPFVNSSKAAEALETAYIHANGNPALLTELSVAWGQAGYAKRGAERDAVVIAKMDNLVNDWAARGVATLTAEQAAEKQQRYSLAINTPSYQERTERALAQAAEIKPGNASVNPTQVALVNLAEFKQR